MTITSIGYDGSVDELQSARFFPRIGGADYGVLDPSHWKLSPHPSTARAVNLSAGIGYGDSVMDSSDSVATVQCDPITSGTRWDMIVARRNWQPLAGVTTFTKVTGGASKALPVREHNPGVLAEQPLWLVQWTAGQTQPTAIVDLRCFAGPGGIYANDFLSLGYLDVPGSRVQVGSRAWRYTPDPTGSPAWAVDSVTSALSMTGTPYKNYGGAYAAPSWTVHPSGLISLAGSVGHNVAVVKHDYQKEYQFGAIPAWAAPPAKTPFPVGMSAPHMVQAIGYAYPDGKLTYSVATTAAAELWMSLNACWIARGGIS
ncbi:conserved hypothetical protein [Arthrobacter sp. 9V]|uniref:hypothetical protein n=1 Tax=Arthrobacter sp. 9V TaxID=2653132 RepID=UPI0012F22671|nr:hypothetical protein [Arthrobacter sp. 9V]VXB24604.1 conserved hypothetical protein [Arthrobacter sp. 9V]